MQSGFAIGNRATRNRCTGGPSSRRKAAAWCVAVATALAAILSTGCEEGQPPYQVIPGDSAPDYLPEDVVPGTTSSFDSLYCYDPTTYQTVSPGAADPRYVRRDQILVRLNAPADELLQPDLRDDELKRVYAHPNLLGFKRAATPEERGAIQAGPVSGDAADYLPLGGGPSVWFYNHNEFLWTRTDTLVGPDLAPDSQNWPHNSVYRLRSRNIVTNSPETSAFDPPQYDADYLISAVPGVGIFYHGFTLIAERVENVGEGVPAIQRNPRFAWLTLESLGQPDPNEPLPTTIDQCVDGLWGDVDLFPIHLAGQIPSQVPNTVAGQMQVGDHFTTWTYITIDRQSLIGRLQMELERKVQCELDPRGCTALDFIDQCSGTGVETAPPFPTGTFSLLARYDAVVEDAYDFFEVRGGQAGADAVVGVYGQGDDNGEIDVVKIVFTMSLGAPIAGLVERLDLYLQRGVGPVLQFTGTDPDTRNRTRLRSCVINGQTFDEAFFQYEN